jgi:hypothetical protein
VAGQVLADDLVLLGCLDAQIAAAEATTPQLLPDTPFSPLTTVPGWGTVRAANHAAIGDLDRWPGARQLRRASGLSCTRARKWRSRCRRVSSEDFYAEELPVHQVNVDGFWMDQHPVPVFSVPSSHPGRWCRIGAVVFVAV